MTHPAIGILMRPYGAGRDERYNLMLSADEDDLIQRVADRYAKGNRGKGDKAKAIRFAVALVFLAERDAPDLLEHLQAQLDANKR